VTSTNVASAIYSFPLCVECSAGDYIKYCEGDAGNGYNGMCFGA
jgi:hypothetical protein